MGVIAQTPVVGTATKSLLLKLKITKCVSLKKDEKMETLKIDILDPKAKNLLENLADLKLISIQTVKNSSQDFTRLLQRLRRNSDKAPSLKEIAKEVETVRQKRYGK